MSRKTLKTITYGLYVTALLLPGLLPLLSLIGNGSLSFLSFETLLALNMVGWILVVVSILIHQVLKSKISQVSSNVGLSTQKQSLEEQVHKILREVQRKNRALSLDHMEKGIVSEGELSDSLRTIVALAYGLLKAESAEIALFDQDSEMYHSSFVMGRPFRTSSQAMLSGAVEGDERLPSPDVIVQEISFSGSTLGSLRISLKRGLLPSRADQEVAAILALQAGLAIINAQYSNELIRMKRSSDESTKAKTGFLANLSHEIRGPLGIIINAVELVIDGLCGPVNEDQIDTLNMVGSNGQHLLELINDVLDYAKIESGVITPKTEVLKLGDLLKDISNVVRVQADAKSHHLTLKADSEDLFVSCDRRHFRQMMINLLTNAIKYTPDGGTIEIWAERSTRKKATINVRDSGIGIADSEKAKVFSAFERIEEQYALTQQGTGLGMTLTRRLAEVNNGNIDFRSIYGEGSHFWLTFPLVAEQTDSFEDISEEDEEAEGLGNLILVQESDEGERKMLVRYLSHIGFRVMSSDNPSEMKSVLQEGRVDLAMIDNNFIDRTEEDIISAIRENSDTSSLPIVMTSSRAFVFDIEKYLKAGVDLCLIKPVPLKKLGRICRQLIDGEYKGEKVDRDTLVSVKKESSEREP